MPAFSFSKQKKQPSFVKFDKQVPTVGKYNVTQTNFNSRIKTAPSMSLPKASRQTSQKKIVPGPGAYDNLTSLSHKSQGVSMKGTHEMKIKTQGPSPGQYQVKYEFPTKKYSFSKSSQKKVVKQGPDPSTYNVKFDVMNTTSNYIFSKSERQTFQKKEWAKNIAPGCYDVKQNLITQQKNKFSFPKKQKFKEEMLQVKQKTIIPGPGKYDIGNARQSRNSLKFALAAKAIQIKQQAPGPGSYKIPQSVTSPKNGIVIGKQPRQTKYNSLAPGPGAYELQKALSIKSKQAPAVVFPKQERLKSDKNGISLGPGQYDVAYDELIKKRNKGFSIKGRTVIQKIQQTPGPQAYNPDFRKIHSSAQRSVFGKQRRLSLETSKNPGPGAYQPKQKVFSKTFYFNKSGSKSVDGKQQKIGPGYYKLKPFFGQFDGKDKVGEKAETLYV